MSMGKSLAKAFTGIVMAFLGMNMMLSALFYGVIASLLAYFGSSLSFLFGLSILGFAIGSVLLLIGSKWLFENEGGFIKLGIGVLGIYLFIVGVLIALSGTVTFGLPLFAAMLVFSVSLAMIGYGFDIKPLNPLGKLIKVYKTQILSIR